jgi:hypothetical protein
MIAPWYTMLYIGLERIAWRHGYCLSLHGSMGRDLDIILIPWIEDAEEPKKLLKSFQKFISMKGKINMGGIPIAENKPHGRKAYSIPIGIEGHYLDISIIPKVEKL